MLKVTEINDEQMNEVVKRFIKEGFKVPLSIDPFLRDSQYIDIETILSSDKYTIGLLESSMGHFLQLINNKNEDPVIYKGYDELQSGKNSTFSPITYEDFYLVVRYCYIIKKKAREVYNTEIELALSSLKN